MHFFMQQSSTRTLVLSRHYELHLVIAVLWLSISSISYFSVHASTHSLPRHSSPAASVDNAKHQVKALWSSLYQRTTNLVNSTLEAAAADYHSKNSRRSSDLLQLDLSGNFDIALLGPTSAVSRETTSSPLQTQSVSSLPLVHSSIGGALLPLIKVGCKYDIAQSWLAVTSVFTKLQWRPPVTNQGTSSGLEFDVVTEKSLLFPQNPSFGQLRIHLRPNNGDEDLSLPLVHTNFLFRRKHVFSSITFFIPLLRHKLQWQCTIFNEDHAARRKRLFRMHQPYLQKHSNFDADVIDDDNNEYDSNEYGNPWWLPTMTVNAAGTLDVLSQATFPHPLASNKRNLDSAVTMDDIDSYGAYNSGNSITKNGKRNFQLNQVFKDHRMGIRISARRQLDWGILGFGALSGNRASLMDNPPCTLLRLQIQDMGKEAITGLLVETHLEQPFASLRFVIQSEISADRLLGQS